MQQQEDMKQKIVRYEEFVNERLRVDLRHVLDARDAVRENIAEYLQLRNILENIESSVAQGDIKTMVDLGANFYAQAKIPDASRVIIFVGLGLFLELTLEEAKTFIDSKVEQLNARDKLLSEQATEINARIKLVLEGLRELQLTGLSPQEAPRIVW